MEVSMSEIKISKVKETKISNVDFSNLTFGTIFTDHMLVCDFINGAWQTPEIKGYAPFVMDPSAKVFHYGQAIFEGMKAYKDSNEDVWLFRPDQNFERFNKSAVRMCMPEVPQDVFMNGLKTLLDIDRNWVQKGVGNSLYIRPFMISTENAVMASPSTDFRFCIILSPVNAYYTGDVKVVIAEHYSRAANGGIGAAKAAGNYAGQFYPTKLASAQGYQQIIWTDDATHTKLEEAGTMNVFFRINDTLITAPTSERILDGVTRKSVIDVAKSKGIRVEIRDVFVDEIVEAAKSGTLKEIFGAGTAAIISPISAFSYQENSFDLAKQENSFAKDIKETIQNIQHKLTVDTFNWTIKV